MAAHIAQQHLWIIAAENKLPAAAQNHLEPFIPLSHVNLGTFSIFYSVTAEIPDSGEINNLHLLHLQPGNLVVAKVKGVIAEIKAVRSYLENQSRLEQKIWKEQSENDKEDDKHGVRCRSGAHRPAFDYLLIEAVPYHHRRHQDRQPEQSEVKLLSFFVDYGRIVHSI